MCLSLKGTHKVIFNMEAFWINSTYLQSASLPQFSNIDDIISEDKLWAEWNLAKLLGRDTATGWMFEFPE